MPGMNGNDMGDAIATAIKGVNSNADLSQLEPYWEVIATAIVDYITAHAIVNPGTMANSGGTVTGFGTLS